MSEAEAPRYWAVVPAAGSGRRLGGETPKQYLALRGRPVIAHTLERLCSHPRIAGVVVAVAPDDPWWPRLALPAGGKAPRVVTGGAERCDSVLAALEALAERGAPGDWVLVHDAVRPCLRAEDLDRLIDALGADEVGGLLAVRVKDTIKRAGSDGAVSATVDRAALWHAQTPQMFRLGALRAALAAALARGRTVTDEAEAMELAGVRPRLVEGHDDNIKITRREDMILAELVLARRAGESV
ncbi:MAG: 2-C-methyl-D-erythritol 4-phosphate cytidylyltransferase [Burkholderiales bacterium]|nr:2-C-methyl-D-erythritol 4-phosphate cytidylyltransferase [Burkholderiales bacterium]